LKIKVNVEAAILADDGSVARQAASSVSGEWVTIHSGGAQLQDMINKCYFSGHQSLYRYHSERQPGALTPGTVLVMGLALTTASQGNIVYFGFGCRKFAN
jgi:hypothetical protein